MNVMRLNLVTNLLWIATLACLCHIMAQAWTTRLSTTRASSSTSRTSRQSPLHPTTTTTTTATAATASATAAAGCAARPAFKRNIAVLGSGGYMGAMTFGYLQRCCSLFGTGMGQCRSLGATADTARRLNTVLSKQFCLAMADESLIKLTNLMDIDMVASRLQGWDALIMGTDLGVSKMPITANTYERSPNDKTWEVYWGPHKTLTSSFDNAEQEKALKQEIIRNVLSASKKAGIQHVVVVDDGNNLNVLDDLKQSGLAYTLIQPKGELVRIPDYTFKKGIQGKLLVTTTQDGNDSPDEDESSAAVGQISMEDLTAMSVQALQSLDWTKNRCLQVIGKGPVEDDDDSVNLKRPDQEWCVDSYHLEVVLAGIQ